MVRLYDLSEKEKINALNEVRILASVRNSNIISFKEVFLEEASSNLWYIFYYYLTELKKIFSIVMEYANAGDLLQKIVDHQKKGNLFQESEIWNIFIQVKLNKKISREFSKKKLACQRFEGIT